MNGDTVPLTVTGNYSSSGTVIDDILQYVKENVTRILSIPRCAPKQDVVSAEMIELKIYPTLSDETFPKNLTTKQIRKLDALKAATGILNDLTPEQMKIFEATVKRRPLFK